MPTAAVGPASTKVASAAGVSVATARTESGARWLDDWRSADATAARAMAVWLAERTGAPIAVHPLDAHRLTDPQPLYAPFPIPPSVPAVELAEGGRVRFGAIELEVLHTPGHTEGSVCLLARDEGLLFSGDTLFAGGWGRVDLPGGSAEAMVESLERLARFLREVREHDAEAGDADGLVRCHGAQALIFGTSASIGAPP